MRDMRILGTRIAGTFAACVLGVMTFAHAGRVVAQEAPATPATVPGAASIHGKVTNPAGMPLNGGSVRLTTEKNPSSSTAKFDYTFPIDANGEYKGSGIKPGNYTAVAFQGTNHVDFQPTQIAAGEDREVDFDMTRKEYIDKMSPADREALEEYKKNAAATLAANAQIKNLNALLTSARADNDAGNYDSAAKKMTDATTAKPDEPILWETLGAAQLGQANVAAKTAKDNKTTDPTVADKYAAAETSYQKAIDLNAKKEKPDPKLTAVSENQLGQAYGKSGKTTDAAAAYELAAKADPTAAATYYFNEAATLLNGNDYDGAAAAADKAIAADPTKADAYYIKAEGLAPKITGPDASGKLIAPPGLVEACNQYLAVAPTGSHAGDMKDLLAGLGQKIDTSYKAAPAPKKK